MYTFHDAVEFLMDSVGGGAQDAEHRVLRQAVFNAYRDLIPVRDWAWYHSSDTVTLSSLSTTTNEDLPWGVSSVDSVFLPQYRINAEYVSPTEWDRVVAADPGSRLMWTIMPPTASTGYYRVRIFNGGQYEDDAVLTYRRRPRDLRFSGYETNSRIGTVNVAAAASIGASVAVTGTSTQFSSLMVGAVIRTSLSSINHPESLTGINPYQTEAVITAVASTTALTASSSMVSAGSTSTKYIITDLLDISPTMYTALLSGAVVWHARMTGKSVEGPLNAYHRDMRLAFEQDNPPVSGQREPMFNKLASWYLPLGPDGGT